MSPSPPRLPEQGHILSASWIDASDVLTERQARDAWRTKQDNTSRPLRLVFVGRLTSAKGVSVLLDAVRSVCQEGLPLELDIFGAGDLEPACRRAAAQSDGSIRLRGTTPYGPEFLAAIREHDAIVVPTLGDEQPRIIYDAFSQALAVLASDTPGNRECIREAVNGLIFRVGDPAALAECLRQVFRNRTLLARLGMAGLVSAGAYTHEVMHRRRFELISQTIARTRWPLDA